MIDSVIESCRSIIVAAIIGTAVSLSVNGLILPEYGTTRFEHLVEHVVLKQVKGILHLSIETQLFKRRRRQAQDLTMTMMTMTTTSVMLVEIKGDTKIAEKSYTRHDPNSDK